MIRYDFALDDLGSHPARDLADVGDRVGDPRAAKPGADLAAPAVDQARCARWSADLDLDPRLRPAAARAGTSPTSSRRRPRRRSPASRTRSSWCARPPSEQIAADVEALNRCGNPTPRPAAVSATTRCGSARPLGGDARGSSGTARVEPDWPRIRSLLEADLLYRSRLLSEGGVERLFADLHPDVGLGRRRARGRRCECTDAVALDGRGAGAGARAPSPASRTSAMTEEPWQPTVIYPARGVGLLWESASAPSGALAKVRRAQPRAAARRPRRAALDHRPRRAPRDDRRRRLPDTSRRCATRACVSARRHGRQVLYCRSRGRRRAVGTA